MTVKVPLYISLDVIMKERLMETSAKTGVSMTRIVEYALDHYLDRILAEAKSGLTKNGNTDSSKYPFLQELSVPKGPKS